MALPNAILPGFSASLWMQNETARTAGTLTTAQLGTWAGQVASLVTATGGGFVVGQTYTIVSTGGTAFTSIGASANTVGISFTATGTGTGITGTAIPTSGAATTNGLSVKVEAVPAFGQDDAVASFSVAGSRQSDKIPVQAAPTSITVTAAWNPSDTTITQLRTDAYSGLTERTYAIAATDGSGNVIAYAFNGRVGSFQIDSQPGAEAKAIFTIHPRGGQYGWSNS